MHLLHGRSIATLLGPRATVLAANRKEVRDDEDPGCRQNLRCLLSSAVALRDPFGSPPQGDHAPGRQPSLEPVSRTDTREVAISYLDSHEQYPDEMLYGARCRDAARSGRKRRRDDVLALEDVELEQVAGEAGDPLQALADAGYITDVVCRVKSGKEATVYCCRAHPSTGRELVAAKVYAIDIGAHHRMSKLYADGRDRMYKPDARAHRAIKARSRFGRQLVFGDWVRQEFANLCVLHRAGADVPQPIHQCGSGIVMDYIGDATRPAPMLVGATLSPEEAQRLFDKAMWNIRLFLAKDCVHGDLSPYNMLLWNDRLVIIDLPQMVHARWNDEALKVLQRDIENIVGFFAKYGVRASTADLALDLWARYRRAELDVE